MLKFGYIKYNPYFCIVEKRQRVWHRQENITSVARAAVGEFGMLKVKKSWDVALIFMQWKACIN